MRDVVNEESGDGRSIRMIQHTTRRIVVKDYVFFIFPIMLRLFFS
ncbi:hypothetical protein HanPSC8_Chr16g0697381 [Helianthus annuus]|nr:hypothetical protein HanPSC8_Chr16g0697381 [Helianthus annuus]